MKIINLNIYICVNLADEKNGREEIKKRVDDANKFVQTVDDDIKKFTEAGKSHLLSLIKRQEILLRVYISDLKTYITSSYVQWNNVHEIERQLDYYEKLMKQEIQNIQKVVDKHNQIIKTKKELIEKGNRLVEDTKNEIEKYGNEDSSNDINELNNEITQIENLMKELDRLNDDEDLSKVEEQLTRAENAMKNLLDNIQRQHTTTTQQPTTTEKPTTTQKPTTKPFKPSTQNPKILWLEKRAKLIKTSEELLNKEQIESNHFSKNDPNIDAVVLRNQITQMQNFIQNLRHLLYGDDLDKEEQTLISYQTSFRDLLDRLRTTPKPQFY